jgi:hypothetical protein
MSSLLPAGLALLGVGMFALSLWFQEAGMPVARDQPAQPLPVWRETVPPPPPAPPEAAEPPSLAVELVP